jgi:hypothetical protein
MCSPHHKTMNVVAGRLTRFVEDPMKSQRAPKAPLPFTDRGSIATLWTLLKLVLALSPWNSFKGAAAVTLAETAAETAIAAILFFLRGK